MLTATHKKILGAVAFCVIVLGFFVVKNIFTTEDEFIPEVVEKVTVEKKVVGQSVEGRDIEVYSYGSGNTHLAFIGGIHGGYEWNSTLLAYTVMEYLEKNPEAVPENVTVDIVPSANPDATYVVTGKEGEFMAGDVTDDTKTLESARFNSNDVDINRNFDCAWDPKSTWRSKEVSGGTAAFSEPEAKAVKNYIETYSPTAVVFWHSQANAVYASQCGDGPLSETVNLMNLYADASGYKAVEVFDAYTVTGAADDWLATVGIPAVTVELKTHESIDWEKNLAGIKALFEYYSK